LGVSQIALTRGWPSSAPEEVARLASMISLGEGSTPVIEAPRLARRVGVARVLMKLENRNPSGTFIDRGTVYAVAAAKAAGCGWVTAAAGGDAAVSIAAYCARAGLGLTIYVPKWANVTSIAQARLMGARVIYTQSWEEAVRKVLGSVCGLVPSTGYFLLGYAGIAEEIAPVVKEVDHIVMPTSNGGLATAIYEGLRRVGSEIPAIHVVQDSRCPVIASEVLGYPVRESGDEGETGVCYPVMGRAAVEAVRGSGGSAAIVDDEAINDAASILASSEGVVAGRASAVAVAGLSALVSRGVIGEGETVLLIVTGSAPTYLETIPIVVRATMSRRSICDEVYAVLRNGPNHVRGVWNVLRQVGRRCSISSVSECVKRLEAEGRVRCFKEGKKKVCVASEG